MKLNFEKFLNDNGLKIGDKIHFKDNDNFSSDYEIVKEESSLYLKCALGYIGINFLQHFDFEIIKSKEKVGDLICEVGACEKCPLKCITCAGYTHNTLRERFEAILKAYPQLEPIRPYLEKELDKEVK